MRFSCMRDKSLAQMQDLKVVTNDLKIRNQYEIHSKVRFAYVLGYI